MKKVKTKKNYPYPTFIIGVDIGNEFVKTVDMAIPNGIRSRLDVLDAKKCFIKGGKKYSIGEGHVAYEADRTKNNAYRDTLQFVITKTLYDNDYPSGEYGFFVGLGLPYQHWAVQKEKLKSYIKKEATAKVLHQDKEYRIHVLEVAVMPQGYSALVTKLNDYLNVNLIADAGGGTLDVICIEDGSINEKDSYTVKIGTRDMYSNARGKVTESLMMELKDSVIDSYIVNGNDNRHVATSVANCINEAIYEYSKDIFNELKEHGYEESMMKLTFMGGGAGLIRRGAQHNPDRVYYQTDIHANAKGFEDFLLKKLVKERVVYEY